MGNRADFMITIHDPHHRDLSGEIAATLSEISGYMWHDERGVVARYDAKWPESDRDFAALSREFPDAKLSLCISPHSEDTDVIVDAYQGKTDVRAGVMTFPARTLWDDEPEPDFEVENHGTICLLRPNTTAAKAWVEAKIADDAMWYARAVVVEPRYLPDIVDGIEADGLTVA